MWTRQHKQRNTGRLIIPSLCAAFLAYFGFHAYHGEFGIKGGPFWNGTAIRAGVGETQLWTITNNAVWAHPIHLHGFFFQVVDENGAPVHPIAWKDTISVPADKTVRVLVRFDRPGSWMFHCHILDHAEAGLMSTVDVGDNLPEHIHRHTGP